MTTLLVVDDSPANLFLARSIFEPNGYKVITASEGIQALALAREYHPDMIISDVNMAQGGGFELLKLLKADAALSLILFVFLTCTAWHRRDREKGLALGADHFILRPIAPQLLLDLIGDCFRKDQREN